MSQINKIINDYENWMISSKDMKSPSKWVESSEKVMDYDELLPIYAFRFFWKDNIPTMQLKISGDLSSDNQISITSSATISKILTSRGIIS